MRALLDKGSRVCLTGSNASLLGRKPGSKLTGRHLSHEVFPFSYREFLELTAQQPGVDSLQQYLERGGFAAALAAGPCMAPHFCASFCAMSCSATSSRVMPCEPLGL